MEVVCDDVTGEVVRRVRRPWERERTTTPGGGESMVQEQFVDQTDVNAIVARFARTGVLPEPSMQGQYGDVTGLQVDLTEALNRSNDTIRRAREFGDNWKEEPEAAPPAAPPPVVEPPTAP